MDKRSSGVRIQIRPKKNKKSAKKRKTRTHSAFRYYERKRMKQSLEKVGHLRKKPRKRAREAAAPNLSSEFHCQRAKTTPQEAQMFSKHMYRYK